MGARVRKVRRRSTAAEAGATAVEYALMVMLIGLVIIASVALMGTTLSTIFSSMAVGI